MTHRLLSIIQTPTFGGPHNQMLRLTEPLAEQGWDTLVVLPQESETGVERLQAASIKLEQVLIHRLRKKLNPRYHIDFVRGFGRTVNQLRQVIRENEIDVVQVCGLMSIHGAIAAYRERVPIVWQLLSTFAPRPLRRLLTLFVRRMADVVMTTGIQVGHEHPGLDRIADRIIPFYPPVDTALFTADPVRRAQARAELGVPDDAVLVGTVGNQNWQKGHEFFVEVANRVRQTHSQAYFRVLGARTPANAAYYEQHVKQQARSYGLMRDGVIDFVEPGSRVPDLLPAFDIFLLTSRAEGVPTSMLEAMACGIPVISTNVGAVAEVVEDDTTGYVVPPIDVKQLTASVQQLLNQPEQRRAMGRAAREQALKRFDVQVCVNTHVQAYEKALSAKSSSAPFLEEAAA